MPKFSTLPRGSAEVATLAITCERREILMLGQDKIELYLSCKRIKKARSWHSLTLLKVSVPTTLRVVLARPLAIKFQGHPKSQWKAQTYSRALSERINKWSKYQHGYFIVSTKGWQNGLSLQELWPKMKIEALVGVENIKTLPKISISKNSVFNNNYDNDITKLVFWFL